MKVENVGFHTQSLLLPSLLHLSLNKEPVDVQHFGKQDMSQNMKPILQPSSSDRLGTALCSTKERQCSPMLIFPEKMIAYTDNYIKLDDIELRPQMCQCHGRLAK